MWQEMQNCLQDIPIKLFRGFIWCMFQLPGRRLTLLNSYFFVVQTQISVHIHTSEPIQSIFTLCRPKFLKCFSELKDRSLVAGVTGKMAKSCNKTDRDGHVPSSTATRNARTTLLGLFTGCRCHYGCHLKYPVINTRIPNPGISESGNFLIAKSKVLTMTKHYKVMHAAETVTRRGRLNLGRSLNCMTI